MRAEQVRGGDGFENPGVRFPAETFGMKNRRRVRAHGRRAEQGTRELIDDGKKSGQ